MDDATAARTWDQWTDNGRTPDGIDEWPALLRSLDATDPDYKD